MSDSNDRILQVSKNANDTAALVWSVADDLVGAYKPHEYGLVILPMTVIKRFHDCLLPTHQAVLDTYKKVEKLAVKDGFLRKASGYQFYNTSPFTFKTLLADPENIVENFRAYLNGFSDNVLDILARMEFDAQIKHMDEAGLLYQVITDFCDARGDFSPEKISAVDMGYVFENLVRRFSESYNEEAGAHFTSRDIIYLMSDLLVAGDDSAFTGDGISKTVYDMTMGMYINPTEGLITFSIVQGKIDPSAVQVYISMAKLIEGEIYKRLINARLLIARNNDQKILKFPYKHIYIFPDEELPVTSCDDDTLLEMAPYTAIRFFIPITAKNRPRFISDLHIFDNVRMPYNSQFEQITEEEQLAIFERLAPEYTVVLKEKNNVVIPETKDDIPSGSEVISGKEVEFRTFYLDNYQVAQINDMGRGHRVILANAGAGKSVLLLSKAFKYASMYKNSKTHNRCSYAASSS